MIAAAPVIFENAEASVINSCALHQSTERLAFQITGSTRHGGEKGNTKQGYEERVDKEKQDHSKGD